QLDAAAIRVRNRLEDVGEVELPADLAVIAQEDWAYCIDTMAARVLPFLSPLADILRTAGAFRRMSEDDRRRLITIASDSGYFEEDISEDLGLLFKTRSDPPRPEW